MAYEDDPDGEAPPSQGSDQPSQSSEGEGEWVRAKEQGPPPQEAQGEAQGEWVRSPTQGPPPAEGEPEPEGQLASGARAAAHAVIPGLAGAASWVPGAAAGAAIGSAIPGLGTAVGSVVGGLLSSFAGGGAAALAQEWLLKKFGFDDEANQAANVKENPVATGIGSVLGTAVAFTPGGAGALAARVLRGGMIEGDIGQLVGRGAAAAVGGGVDLAQTGDPTHAAAVGATSTLLGAPTAAGRAVMGASERLTAKLGLGGAPAEKLTSTLARAMSEDPKGAQAETNPATGAMPDGAATKIPIDPTAARDAVETSGTDTPGAVSAAGTAESAIPPARKGIATGEPQNTPPRDQGNDGHFAKAHRPGEEGGNTPTPLGQLDPAIEAVMRKEGVEPRRPGEPRLDASPEEINQRMQEQGVPPRQQAQQEQPKVPEILTPAEREELRKQMTGEPTAAEGSVRFYHGGHEPTSGGPRWVTPDQTYAQNFRRGETPNEVHYVDVPKGHPAEVAARSWDELDAGTNRVGHYQNTEFPEELAKQMKPVTGEARTATADRTPELVKSLQEAEAKRAADAENPPAGPEISAAMQRTLDAAAKHAPTLRAARQQDEPSTPRGPPKPPGGEPPEGGPPKPPKEQPAAPEPTERYKLGAKDTPRAAAETVNRGFDNLIRNMSARARDYFNRSRETVKDYSSLLGKGGEDLHHAIETGKLEELRQTNPKLVEGYERLAARYGPEIRAMEQELVKRGKMPAEELGDPNYVHRIRRMPFSLAKWLDRDPTGMMRGMFKPDAFKGLEHRGAEAADGSRIVIQEMGPSKFGVWKNGEQSIRSIDRPEGVEAFKTGDKFEYNGKEYTVDRGTTKEITQHARDKYGEPVRYKEHAPLSLFEQHQQLKSAIEHDDMIRTFKSDPELDPYRVKASTYEGRQAIKNDGWQELDGKAFKDFEGLAMHPDMAQAIKNNFDPGLGMSSNKAINFVRALNQFAVRSIFYNPIPHSANAALHYITARGEDWLPMTFKKDSFMPDKITFENYRNLWKSLQEGWKDVYNQRDSLIDLNRAGMPLVQSAKQMNDMHKLMGSIYNASLKSEPHFWGQMASKYGLGKPVDLVKAVYDKSSDFLWTAGDIMMAARNHELRMKGMSREKALTDQTVHMPDYVLPTHLLGVRGLPSMMADSVIPMFGRYHTKVIDSLMHMSMDALGPKSSVEERRKAFGNIMALAAMGTVVYPALDYLVQSATGNKDAKVNRRGPLAPLSNIYEAAKGERTYGSAASNLATLSPGARAIVDVLSNRDFAGRSIIEPKSPFHKQAAQIADYTAQSMIAPYALASKTLNPKSTGHGPLTTLAEQFADVKVPTEGQQRGKYKGEQARQKQAAQRDKKPRGLIETGVTAVTPRTPKVQQRATSTLTKPQDGWVRSPTQGPPP